MDHNHVVKDRHLAPAHCSRKPHNYLAEKATIGIRFDNEWHHEFLKQVFTMKGRLEARTTG